MHYLIVMLQFDWQLHGFAFWANGDGTLVHYLIVMLEFD